jgi:hypothetical protein
MRKVVVVAVGLGSLAAIAYSAASGKDCARELSGCLSDPPLFVKLNAADGKTYCQERFRACRLHNAWTAAERAAAKQEAADAGPFVVTRGVVVDSTE